MFDYISGWTRTLADGTRVVVPGQLALFNNEQAGQWTTRPKSILVDSEQLESGEGMSDEFKKPVRGRSGVNLVVEVSGENRKDKAAKVNAAQTLWVPAINNHGGFGRWAFVEVTDPWDAKNTIQAALAGQMQTA